MLSDEQLEDLVRGHYFCQRVCDEDVEFARKVERAVRNATLEEVAQMVEGIQLPDDDYAQISTLFAERDAMQGCVDVLRESPYEKINDWLGKRTTVLAKLDEQKEGASEQKPPPS